jgi:predicted O-methyltransferase YrrM
LQYFVQRLPARATIVEIGSYMGLSTLVMARTLF